MFGILHYVFSQYYVGLDCSVWTFIILFNLLICEGRGDIRKFMGFIDSFVSCQDYSGLNLSIFFFFFVQGGRSHWIVKP